MLPWKQHRLPLCFTWSRVSGCRQFLGPWSLVPAAAGTLGPTQAAEYDSSLDCFWLSIGYKGAIDGVPWVDRVAAALKLSVKAISRGESVLIHCRAGKHRTGVFATMLLACLSRDFWEPLPAQG